MGTGNVYPDSLANGGCNVHKSLKTYNAPQFKILTPEQAAVELRAKALPGECRCPAALEDGNTVKRKSRGQCRLNKVLPEAQASEF